MAALALRHAGLRTGNQGSLAPGLLKIQVQIAESSTAESLAVVPTKSVG
jgi:hypothetical protein